MITKGHSQIYRHLLFYFFILMPMTFLEGKSSETNSELARQQLARNILSQLERGQEVPGVLPLGNSSRPSEQLKDFESLLTPPVGSAEKWTISDPQVDAFFKGLFRELVQKARLQGIQVELSAFDLFHGHAFLYSLSPLNPRPQLAIIFHAKEYPNDPDLVYQNAGRGKNSPFSTRHPHYAFRNFLWIHSQNRYWVFDARDNSPLSKTLFLPPFFDLQESDPERRHILSLFLKANTLQEIYFAEKGKTLCTLNFSLSPLPANDDRKIHELILTR